MRPATAVADYLAHLDVERGSSVNTLRSYRRDLDRYLAHLDAAGIGDLGEVGESHVAEFLVALRRGDDEHPPLATSSAGRAVVAVRGLHRFAAAEGSVGRDVARGVTPPAPPKRLPKALPVDRVIALLEACPDGETADVAALRDRALLELLYSTGARISEAIGLDVDDVDAHDRSVLLTGKGNKQRRVPIGRPALAALVPDEMVDEVLGNMLSPAKAAAAQAPASAAASAAPAR